MDAVLVGLGEVGRALYEVLRRSHDIYPHDPELALEARDDWYDLLLISFPYSLKFFDQVKEYQARFQTKATVIFSTVPVGLSKELDAIHSPIEGRHDNMVGSIRLFPRFIGGGNLEQRKVVADFFEQAGLNVIQVICSEATEFAKLQSLAIYGINIEWARHCGKVMAELGINQEWLTLYNHEYNKLVEANGQSQFCRYNLDPPEGVIGGHCVLQNMDLLNQQYPHPLSGVVLDLNKLLKIEEDHDGDN